MRPDDIIEELAMALRDVIQDTPDTQPDDSPEDVYHDLAFRLVTRLSGTLTVVPTRFPKPEGDVEGVRILIGRLTAFVTQAHGDGYDPVAIMTALLDAWVRVSMAYTQRTFGAALRSLAATALDLDRMHQNRKGIN